MRLRLEYRKIGPFRFISHLDWLNSLKKAIRRASIPVSYTLGFSPQMKVMLGIPLPIGVEGLREYLDLELEREMSSEEVLKKLNRELPEELRMSRCEIAPAFEISKFVNFAVYDLFLREEEPLDFTNFGAKLHRVDRLSSKVVRLYLFQEANTVGIVKLLFSSGLSWEKVFLIRRIGSWRFEGEVLINPFGEVEHLD